MGSIQAIYLCREADSELQEASEARLEAGKGIVGDRYYYQEGSFSGQPLADPKRRDITFIDRQAIDSFNKREGLSLGYGELRRNVLTDGVDLNALLGREFSIGDCRFYGLELCEPCKPLAKRVHPALYPGMMGQCGIRALVLSDGTLKAGDSFSDTTTAA